MTVSSPPHEVINPDLRLRSANFGTLPSGDRTVEHLTASGGHPPYRFYIMPEPGGPAIPSWIRLAPDGTLNLEPPADLNTTLNLPVEVVDSNGERSVVWN